MNIKASLICEDVRLEVGGTLTLVGVFNDRIIVDAGEGEIVIPRLSFIVVLAGATGVERVAFRQRIRNVAEADPPAPALAFELHNPASDEHNFILSQAPMAFPGPGTYEVIFEIVVPSELIAHRFRFHVQRRQV